MCRLQADAGVCDTTSIAGESTAQLTATSVACRTADCVSSRGRRLSLGSPGRNTSRVNETVTFAAVAKWVSVVSNCTPRLGFAGGAEPRTPDGPGREAQESALAGAPQARRRALGAAAPEWRAALRRKPWTTCLPQASLLRIWLRGKYSGCRSSRPMKRGGSSRSGETPSIKARNASLLDTRFAPMSVTTPGYGRWPSRIRSSALRIGSSSGSFSAVSGYAARTRPRAASHCVRATDLERLGKAHDHAAAWERPPALDEADVSAVWCRRATRARVD